jgi:apolipoprotein N-acyltransferase
MFSRLARDQVKKGAQILILITNDAWFLQTAGVSQHARFLVLQAIENRRPALQLGNSGMTYWVNAKGQIQKQLPPYQTLGAVWQIPLAALK